MLCHLVLIGIFFLIVRFYQRRTKYPPGPFPFPIIGNLPSFVISYLLNGDGLGVVMLKWKQKFGGVFTVWFGPIPVVAVADYEVAVQTYLRDGDAHALRFNIPLFELLRGGYGIIMSNGGRWLEQRRFALHVLRNFGVGKNLMQEQILKEFRCRIEPIDDEIQANGGKLKLEPRSKFVDVLAGSIINLVMVGYSFDDSNIEEFREMRADIERALLEFNVLDLALVNEFTKNLPVLKERYRQVKEVQEKPIAFVMKQISNRKNDILAGRRELDYHVPPGDFLDAYLLEMKRREENGLEPGHFNEKQLAFSILDMWQAGMDTTIATVSWAFAFLANHPDVQEKMREEMWRVVGRNRDVEMGDKLVLPYCSAVITETHRLAAILNLNVWRETTKSCLIGGHHVPEGTASAVMMSVIFRDESVFEQPMEFKPERFVDDKQLEQKVMPFGLGKRQCLGEGLARAEIFLIILNVVRSYRLLDEDGTIDWRRGSEFGFARIPMSYEVTFQKV